MSFSIDKDYECLNCPVHTRKESYYFIPSKELEYRQDPDNPQIIQRFIHWKPMLEGYTDLEKSFLKDFAKFYKEKLKEQEQNPDKKDNIELPSDFTLEEMIRIINCGQFDNDKSLNALKTYLSYRNNNIKSEKYDEILKTGFLYQHGLTHNYEPILLLKVKFLKEFSNKYTGEDMLVTVDKFLTYLSKHFFIPGQVERWQMIVDLQKFEMPKVDMMKQVFGVLQGKYICRLNTMYFINPPPGMKFLFKIVSAFIDDDTKKKFIFVEREDISPLFKMINKSQVEEQYGGTAKDKTDFDCPFFMPEGDNTVGELKGKLVTENEYLDMCEGYKVSVISPYAKEEHAHLKKINPVNNLIKDIFVRMENETITSKKQEEGIELEAKEGLASRCQCKCTIF